MTPTRTSPLPGLGWAKREDESHPLYGGNKVRKLAAILRDARGRRATRLVTAGAAGSHHVTATALHASALGIEVHAVLGPQFDSADARAHLAVIAATCASVTPVSNAAHLSAHLSTAAERLHALRVPIGGTSAEGTAGSIGLGVELAADLEAHPAEEVVVAFGSGGTALGIAMGLAIAGAARPVRAVQVSPRVFRRRKRLRRLAVAGAKAWNRDGGVPVSLETVDKALGCLHLVEVKGDPGYSRPFEDAASAVAAGRALGLPLEETYSGRAFAHLLRHPPKGGAAFVVTGSAHLPLAPPPPRQLQALLVEEP